MRPARSLVLALLVSVGASSLALPVAADTAQDKAMAVQLFKDGKELMNKGNFVEACPKFEASARLDPTADGTILNLGLCYEGLGKFATAWGYFNESVARAKKSVPPRPDREQMARDHIAAIEPKLSKVTIRVSAEAKIPGLIVEWDGKALSEGAWNTAVPVDAGSHHIAVMAPGHMRWEADVDVGANAEKKTVDVPKLGNEASGGTANTATGAPETPAKANEGGVPTMTYVLGGVGLAMIGGGIAAHFAAVGASNDREAHCKTVASLTCDDDYNVSTIHRWDAISWGLIGAGVVSAGVGVGLYFTSKSSSGSATASNPPAFAVSIVGNGVRIEGAF